MLFEMTDHKKRLAVYGVDFADEVRGRQKILHFRKLNIKLQSFERTFKLSS